MGRIVEMSGQERIIGEHIERIIEESERR